MNRKPLRSKGKPSIVNQRPRVSASMAVLALSFIFLSPVLIMGLLYQMLEKCQPLLCFRVDQAVGCIFDERGSGVQEVEAIRVSRP